MCKPLCLFSPPNLRVVDLSVPCLQICVHTRIHRESRSSCIHTRTWKHSHGSTHTVASPLHLVSFQREAQAVWKRDALGPGLGPVSPGNYPCPCCCVPGLWDRPILSDNLLQRDFDGRSGHGVCLGLCRLTCWERKSLEDKKRSMSQQGSSSAWTYWGGGQGSACVLGMISSSRVQRKDSVLHLIKKNIMKKRNSTQQGWKQFQQWLK